MSAAYQVYFITLLVYFGVNLIACWSLNLQYGVTGILNFAFILFQAMGAYAAAVLTLGPGGKSGFQSYVAGANLPWPLPLLAAMVVGAALAGVIGIFAFMPLRRDFQAMVMLVVSLIALSLVSTEQSWFNGVAGLVEIPRPFARAFGANDISYGWFYVGLTGVVTTGVGVLVWRITGSPWGLRLRAVRDNGEAAESLGIDMRREAMKVYMLGGALAALSGAVLVEFIQAWSPGSWSISETFLYFVAVIIGGAGNNWGAALGAALVLGLIGEAIHYFPSIGYSGLAQSIQFAMWGVLIIGFLWWRPQGILPERKRRYATSSGSRKR